MKIKKTTLALACALALVNSAQAAIPESGSVDENQFSVTWSGDTPPPVSSASSDCQPAAPLLGDPGCDAFALTINAPQSGDYQVQIVLTASPADDWDLVVEDAQGNPVGSSGNSPGSPETVTLINPPSGAYTVLASPYAVVTAYQAEATFSIVDSGPSGDASIGGQRFINLAPPGAGELDPNHEVYAPAVGDAGVGLSAGEPTIGIPHKNNLQRRVSHPNSNQLMYIAGLETLRVTVDERTDPPVAHWEDKSVPTHITTLDPILHTDWDTGRTISTQLNAKRSLMSLSDDNGDTWTESPQGAGINAGVDHQTVGSGPYPDSFLGLSLFDSAFYYASQDIAIAQIARSDDGGLTWGAAVPMYNISECGGLHGHIQVAPNDGSVYVPNGDCPLGQSGFARSDDAGLTWQVIGVPGIPSGDDPGMAVASDGTIYFGQCINDSTPVVSVSTDKGETWFGPTTVDPGLGLKQCVFPTMVAGDGDRAALAFLASSDPGPGTGTDVEAFTGAYYAYVSITYDGGQTWETVNVTPGDPVQRGPVCLQGTTCASNRNLLDFNDIQIDELGRIHFAYADGCVGGCVDGGPNSGTDIARIARQQDGTRGLYAQYDGELAPTFAKPAAPYAKAVNIGSVNEITWTRPADFGNAISAYEIYRRAADGAYNMIPIATLMPTQQKFLDSGFSGEVCYRVLARNLYGLSDPKGFEACAGQATSEDFCAGVTRVSDSLGDQLGSSPLDILELQLSEPFFGNPLACNAQSEQKLVFTLDVGAGQVVDGNSWVIMWNRQVPMDDGLGQIYDRSMVNMRIVGTSPVCSYGNITAPSVNQGTDATTLASENCTLSNGTITIQLPVDIIDDCENCPIGPGYELAGLEVRSFAVNASGMPVAQTASNDFGVGIGYTLSGNNACAPDPADGLEAADDNVSIADEFPTIEIPVTANDTFDRCETVEISEATNGAHGIVSILADGTLEYDPVSVFCEDYFTYTLTADDGSTSQAVVTVSSNRAVCQ